MRSNLLRDGRLSRIAICAIALSAGLTMAACSSGTKAASAGDSGSSTKGASSTQRVNGAKNLKIAFFPGGTSTTYQTAENASTINTAKAAGATIQLFDPAFDPTTQFDQMQNAISSGKYNAFILTPISGQVMCPLVKQAIAKGIAVLTAINPVCGLDAKSGDASWYPGTIEAIPAGTPEFWDAFYGYIKDDNPSGGKLIEFNGPEILPLTVNSQNSAQKTFAGSKITIVAKANGDYTTATALSQAENLFKANPDVSIVTSSYSAMTVGIIAAAKSLGILDHLRIYDAGGSKEALDLISDGSIRASAEYNPAKIGELSAQGLIDWANGKTVPRSAEPDLPIQFITKSNVAKFESVAY